MKKVIAISAVFAALVVVMICELVFTARFYASVEDKLQNVKTVVWENKDDLKVEQTSKAIESTVAEWERGKNMLLLVDNHTTVRALDDKIISLKGIIESDNFNDAVIYIDSAINLINDILIDDMPYLINLI